MPNDAATPASFNDQWIPIFQSGSQTDSSGSSRVWTNADLDEIIKNFDAANPSPLVVGHPKNDDPAWGWTAALKRAGNTLLAKFAKVPDVMTAAIREGRYRNRSVKLAKGEGGWKLIHTGLLGAAPPAVEGLAPIAFESEPEGVVVEFDSLNGAGLSLIARGMQKLRELILTHFGVEAANQYAPQSDIDDLANIATAESQADRTDSPPPAFSRQTEEDRKMDKQLQADLDAKSKELDAANSKLAEFAAQQRVVEARRSVDAVLAEGRLTPAQAEGLPEFMASLDAAAEFAFAAGDGTAKKTGGAWFAEFLAKLPKQIELGQKHEGADGVGDSPEAIVAAAREFQKAEKAKGTEVPWHEAVTHVMRKQ